MRRIPQIPSEVVEFEPKREQQQRYDLDDMLEIHRTDRVLAHLLQHRETFCQWQGRGLFSDVGAKSFERASYIRTLQSWTA